MKKKFLILMLAFFIGLPCTLALSACGDKGNVTPKPVALTENMISLEYNYAFYNGLAKEPEVTVIVNKSVVSENEYSVVYSNNINAGMAEVVVSANTDSNVISGSASKTFTINSTRTSIETYEDLKTVISNDNYSSISLTTDLTIPVGETLTIPQNKTLSCGNYKLINNGTLVNNGKIQINVDSKEELVDAFEYANSITLTNDIELNGSPLVIDASTRSYSIDLDLNGFSILGYFKIYAKSTYQANINVKNFFTEDNINKSTIGVTDDTKCQYGLAAFGGNVNLTLFGVNLVGYYGGIATNGNYEGSTISATRCTFTGVSTEIGNNSGVGAYLPAKNSYTFTSCKFEGSSAYYAKSGTHTLTNCEFVATQSTYQVPSHYGSGGNATGSALIVDSSQGYKTPLILTLYNGTFKSVAGYGIEEYCSGDVEDYSTTNYYGEMSYNTAKDNVKVWDSPAN